MLLRKKVYILCLRIDDSVAIGNLLHHINLQRIRAENGSLPSRHRNVVINTGNPSQHTDLLCRSQVPGRIAAVFLSRDIMTACKGHHLDSLDTKHIVVRAKRTIAVALDCTDSSTQFNRRRIPLAGRNVCEQANRAVCLSSLIKRHSRHQNLRKFCPCDIIVRIEIIAVTNHNIQCTEQGCSTFVLRPDNIFRDGSSKYCDLQHHNGHNSHRCYTL